jgi:hypothetical protein
MARRNDIMPIPADRIQLHAHASKLWRGGCGHFQNHVYWHPSSKCEVKLLPPLLEKELLATKASMEAAPTAMALLLHFL